MPIVSDFILPAGVVGLWVQLVNNATAAAYTSIAATDASGKFQISGGPPPAGDYTMSTSLVNGAPWTVRNAHYAVGQQPASQALAFANPLGAIDAGLGALVVVGVLTGNTVVPAPVNPAPGLQLFFLFTQNNVGGWTLVWNMAFKTAWQPSPAANAISMAGFTYDGANWQQNFGDIPVDQLGNVQVQGSLALAKDLRRSLQTIAYAAAITPNAQAGEIVVVGALTAAITVNAPTNPATGQQLTFIFTQGGAGAFTVAWNAVFKTAWQPAIAVGAISVMTFEYDGASWQQLGHISIDQNGNATVQGTLGVAGATALAALAVSGTFDRNAAGQLQIGPVNATTVAIRGPQKSLLVGEALTALGAGAQTLTAAQLLGGVIEHTVTAAVADTTDTGANLDAAIPNVANGDTFECYLTILGAFTVTLTAGAGVTIKGTTALVGVAAGKGAHLIFRRTAVSTWTVYVVLSA